MKLIFLLLTGCAYAQVPTDSVRVKWSPARPFNPMPVVRPGNDFYRDSKDPPHVVRATLDNMPITGPDSSMRYTMPRVPGYVPKIRPR